MRTKTRRQLINAISQPQPEAAPCHTPPLSPLGAAPAENEEPFKMPGILQVCRKREASRPTPHLLQLLLRHCLHAACHMCPTTPLPPQGPSISMPPQLLFILVGVGGGSVGVGANGLPYIKMHSAAAQTINMNLRVRHDQQQQQQQPPGPAVARCTLPAARASISRLWPD